MLQPNLTFRAKGWTVKAGKGGGELEAEVAVFFVVVPKMGAFGSKLLLLNFPGFLLPTRVGLRRSVTLPSLSSARSAPTTLY